MGVTIGFLLLKLGGEEKASLLGFFDSWDFVLHFDVGKSRCV